MSRVGALLLTGNRSLATITADDLIWSKRFDEKFTCIPKRGAEGYGAERELPRFSASNNCKERLHYHG